MKKYMLLYAMVMSPMLYANAHAIDYRLDSAEDTNVFGDYLITGFEHIIPLGLDHILFILCVFFLNTSLKQVLIQASMFTVAHSITLGLAIYGYITPPPHIIEPLIAASILFLALENVFRQKMKPWRIVMVFLFGLVHGMGFAGALSELSMPQNAFATALIGFNLGVEIGQLAIIGFMYLFVSKLFSKKMWYRRRLVIPASLTIAFVAGYWTIERIFFS